MQLSPLQSRLAASTMATILLIIIYFSLFNPQFALAAELSDGPQIPLEEDMFTAEQPDTPVEMRDSLYRPGFPVFGRSILGTRAGDTISLTNNVPVPMNLNAGESLVFVFDSTQLSSRKESTAELELRGEPEGTQEEARDLIVDWDEEVKPSKRATVKTVYISANTCEQPSSNSTASAEAPQLTLYVSNSANNTSPGPSADASQQEVHSFTQGAVMFNYSTSDDLYVTVAANNVSSDFSGIYNFQIAASVDMWYHSYNESIADELFWVDSDTTSVLLITQNLTTSYDKTLQDKLMTSRPYIMFAQNDEDTSINGMRYSYCGLNNYAQIATQRNGQDTSQVTTGITRRGAGGFPKQQFYFSGLNASTKYSGILASNANASSDVNVAGGGGHVYKATTFETKSSNGNCALVFNLTFCDEVAYAVPSNNVTFPNTTVLGEYYDSYAQGLFDGFSKSIAQISCDAPKAQQYSLVRNCTTCTAAYKNWLCSVTIPRCEDFSATDKFLQPRSINETFPNGNTLDPSQLAPYAGNQNQLSFLKSRNPIIDDVIKPGPYKEVLPCEELCYDLVQSCPAALNFACPRQWNYGFNTSYGTRGPGSVRGNITCNYPGSFHFYSGASGSAAPWLMSVVLAWLATAALW